VSGDQDAVYVAHSGGAAAIQGDMTGGSGNALRGTVQNGSTASCGFLWNRNATNTSIVLALENDSTTSGNTLQISNFGTGDCIELNPTANAICMDINKTNTGNAVVIDVQNSGTGNSVLITQDGNGVALNISKTNIGAADLIEVSSSGSGNYVSTTAGGVLGSTGAKLTNAGVWTDGTCYRDTKITIEEITDEQAADFLEKVSQLPVARWTSKYDRSPIPAPILSPFQDELVGWFGLNPNGVAAKEIAAVALVAIKALTKRVKQLEELISKN